MLSLGESRPKAGIIVLPSRIEAEDKKVVEKKKMGPGIIFPAPLLSKIVPVAFRGNPR